MTGTYWKNQEDASSWANAVEIQLNGVLGKVFSGGFTVSLKLPDLKSAQKAKENNRNLHGTLSVRSTTADKGDLKLRLPLPFQGVFVRKGTSAGHARLAVWSAWLGEKPGFRFLTKPGNSDEIQWRSGLIGGAYVGAVCASWQGESDHRKLVPRKGEKLFGTRHLFAPEVEWPDFLREAFRGEGVSPLGLCQDKQTQLECLRKIHALAGSHCRQGAPEPTDLDDLAYRVLVTFPVWLKSTLVEELSALTLALSAGDRKDVLAALMGQRPLAEETAVGLWDKLLEKKNRQLLAVRLRPPGWEGNSQGDDDERKKFQPLQWVEPLNPIDLAALLAQVVRHPYPHEVLENLPAAYRQNHPSFQGRICPVQSPESELVGLTMQLARGASVGWDGHITPADASQPEQELGFGAGLVPFYEHNDGARCMMGAKNLRQAVPVAGRRFPAVPTGGEVAIQQLTQPLVDAGFCEPAVDDSGSLALGTDLLVAYLPWKGLNVDDAIVVGQHVACGGTRVQIKNGAIETAWQGGPLDIAFTRRFRRKLPPGWVPTSLAKNTLMAEESGGLAIEGALLESGSLIAAFALTGAEDRVKWDLRYTDRSPAKLTSIRFTQEKPWLSGMLEYELTKYLPVGVGDKLMGRHGNKGVIGGIVAESEMPRLPDDPKLPTSLRGRRIDVLLNPHGVISRMNLGQLLETHLGWLLNAGFQPNGLVRDGLQVNQNLGQPFLAALDHEKIQDGLEQTGLDRYGRVRLVLPDGTETRSPVVIGFQHIVRLRHVPELKSQARRGGEGAHYSRNTGQALQGRASGGGQRLGEMEVWALAGHEAHHVLAEMLGMKADAVLASGGLKTLLGEQPEPTYGFHARLRDWLFALRIDLILVGSEAKFGLLDDQATLRRISEGKRITQSESMREVVRASFCCRSGRKGGCGHQILDGERIQVGLPARKSAHASLKFEEALFHVGYRSAGPLRMAPETGTYTLPVCRVSDGQADGELAFTFDSSSTQVKATAVPAEAARPERWPAATIGFVLCGQFAAEKGKNADAAEVVRAFSAPDGKWRVGSLLVACPKHTTVPVKAGPPFARGTALAAGGFYDPSLFGSLAKAGLEGDERHWGYLELPFAVPFPVKAFLGETAEVGGFVLRNGIDPTSFPQVQVVPILPPRYRMPHLEPGKIQEDDLLTKGYEPLLKACEAYARSQSNAADLQPAKERIVMAVEKLFRMLARRLNGKHGLFRHDGLGRRVDRSARLVIVPNPALAWDQVGVPTSVLLELLGDELAAWARAKLESRDLVSMLTVATDEAANRQLLSDWSWRKSARKAELLADGKNLLERFLKEHPEVLVILNRQPSLHRDSVQAFHPVPLAPESGEVLQLCPLVCKAFGADFDGDEMAIHLPVSPEARSEASRLLPQHTLRSLATDAVLTSFEQDFVLGLFWASKDEILRKELVALLPDEQCRQWVQENELVAKEGAELLAFLAARHPDKIAEHLHALSKFAYDCCARLGVSFGFYELRELALQCERAGKAAIAKHGARDAAGLSDSLRAVGQAVLEPLLAADQDTFNRPAVHLAAMALSGARGEKQVRQLIVARGFLTPGATGLNQNQNADRFTHGCSLALGMTRDEAFWAAMNSRSSMCDKKLVTREAGYLTRQLVMALWAEQIVEPDCNDWENPSRNPASCLSVGGICACCYDPPTGTNFPVGFPVGLIAAQSIGERGTQLSMQSFHTGQKGFSIREVHKLFRADQFPLAAMEFTGRLKGEDAYRDILDRHFQVVWRVINRIASLHPKEGDFLAPEQLAAKLKAQTDKVSAYLYSRFSEATRMLIDGNPPPANTLQLRATLARELSDIVRGPSIYETGRFFGIKLRPEVLQMRSKTLNEMEQLWFNRMLLEDAYPGQLRPRGRNLLRAAIEGRSLLTHVAFRQQAKRLLVAACLKEAAPLDDPLARVLFNRFTVSTAQP